MLKIGMRRQEKMNMTLVERLLGLMLILAISATGCGESTPPQEVDSGAPTLAGKGDCPTCDEAGPGAMIQAGISDDFYAKGDSWLVAYQFTQRHDMAMDTVLKVPEDEIPMNFGVQSGRDRSPLFLFKYGVNRVHRQIFELEEGGSVQREVATIQVLPGDVDNTPFGELFVQEPFTQLEEKLEFELNDLLDPVSETIFTKDYPNGKRIALSTKSRLKTGSSIFPHTVPRALVNPGYTPGINVELTPELASAADAFDPMWRERVYLTYRFNQVGEEEGRGDLVYWAKGFRWPFYVQTDQGAGVLLRFKSAAPPQEQE
jgi:hypothetical protein